MDKSLHELETTSGSTFKVLSPSLPFELEDTPEGPEENLTKEEDNNEEIPSTQRDNLVDTLHELESGDRKQPDEKEEERGRCGKIQSTLQDSSVLKLLESEKTIHINLVI